MFCHARQRSSRCDTARDAAAAAGLICAYSRSYDMMPPHATLFSTAVTPVARRELQSLLMLFSSHKP